MTRPTAAFLVGPPDELARALAAARDATATTLPPSTTTTPPVSVSTVPGAPRIPNADGG
jgi:hypothetical protein